METDSLYFSDMPLSIQRLGLGKLMRLSKQKKFPMYVRLTGHAEPFWLAGAVKQWLESKQKPAVHQYELNPWSTPPLKDGRAQRSTRLEPLYDGEFARSLEDGDDGLP